MGLFNFFKKKTNPIDEMREQMNNIMFPKGKKDIDSATNELLRILKHSIPFDEAKSILIKSTIICFLSGEKEKFSKERLTLHLKGYCLNHFNDNQISQFYDFIIAMESARTFSNKTPSEVKHIDGGYIW